MTDATKLEQVYDTPMYDAEGAPSSAPDEPESDVLAAEGLGDTESMEGEANPPDSLDADDSPEPERTIPPEVEAELNALRAQREQIEQFQRAQAEQQAQAYWANAWSRIESAYAGEQQKIYAEAEKAYDPAAFIRERMGALESWKQQQTATYYRQREQAVWQFAAQQAVPGYAKVVADHYQLDESDRQRLLKFPPDLMPQIAEELRTIRQEKRKVTAAAVAANNPAPGSGAGSARRRIDPKQGIKSGSRESASLLMSLLNT